jgi:ketosteroid isomerase-like protein
LAEHPNVVFVRRLYQAIIARDTMRVAQLADQDIAFHITGRSMFAGHYRGREQALKVFHDVGAVTGRSVHIDLHDVVGSGEHVVGLHRMRGHRNGKALDQNGCLVCHFSDGALKEAWLAFEDQHQFDAFWE